MQSTRFIALGLVAVCGVVFAQPGMKPISALHPKAPAGAKVFIISPKDGATVGENFTVKFGASGVTVAPATHMAADTGHHHLLIDVDKLPALDKPIPKDAHHLHFGKGQTEAKVHLSPGDHTLQLDFANYAHMQFDPPIVSRRITVHVR